MTRELIERSRQRQGFVDIGLLVTTATLLLSLVVAFTVVSIGIARADTLAGFGGVRGEPFLLTFVIGFVIAGTAGLIAALVHGNSSPVKNVDFRQI